MLLLMGIVEYAPSNEAIYRDPRRTSKCLAGQVLRLVDLLSSSSLSEKISRDI